VKVEQMMNRKVNACHPEDSLNRAAQMMWDSPCGCVVVIDVHNKPIGFLTDRDVCMAAYTSGKALKDLPVQSAMASRIVCCRADDELTAAMTLMREKHVRRMPVLAHDGTLAGILSLDDIAYEAGRPLRGGTNYQLREQVADVFIAISHGRVSARSSH
jgi:CBS-domain-containing membrane protein